MKKLMILCFLIFSFSSHAQSRMWEREYNRLGLQAGINHFDIHTGNFDIQAKTSWTAGFTGRASYYNNFQLIYGLKFFDFNAEIRGRQYIEDETASEQIQFNMIGVQANFFGSYKIIGNYLSVEAGPVLQVNGKFEPRQDKEFFFVEEYDVEAGQIENVSPVNFNVAAGISGGFDRVKFFAQYQYGVNNFLNGLNDEGLEEQDSRATDFSGNLVIITAGAIFFL